MLYDSFNDRFQILGGTSLTDQHLHSISALFHGILISHTFMVCGNACQCICSQISRRQKWCMSVTDSVLKNGQFLMHGYTSVYNRRCIHNLAKSQDPRIIEICLHLSCSEGASIVIDMCSRYTGRHHHIDICRNLLGLFQDIVDSVSS